MTEREDDNIITILNNLVRKRRCSHCGEYFMPKENEQDTFCDRCFNEIKSGENITEYRLEEE